MPQRPNRQAVGSGGGVRRDVELFSVGILLSFIPLLFTIWSATSHLAWIDFSIMRYRYELAYGGLCSLVLVLFEHYRNAHRYVILLSVLSGAFAFAVAIALLMYNNQPGHYNVKEVIADANVADYIIAAGRVSIPLFVVNLLLAVALIMARRVDAFPKPQIRELDRKAKARQKHATRKK